MALLVRIDQDLMNELQYLRRMCSGPCRLRQASTKIYQSHPLNPDRKFRPTKKSLGWPPSTDQLITSPLGPLLFIHIHLTHIERLQALEIRQREPLRGRLACPRRVSRVGLRHWVNRSEHSSLPTIYQISRSTMPSLLGKQVGSTGYGLMGKHPLPSVKLQHSDCASGKD